METSTDTTEGRMTALEAVFACGDENRPAYRADLANAKKELLGLKAEGEQRLALLRDLRRLLDGGALFTPNQGPERDAAVAFLDRLNQLLPEDPRGKARKEGS